MESFVSESLAGRLNSLLPNSRSGEKWGEATKRATEGATERRFRRGRLRPRTEVILEVISSKNTYLNRLADPLGIEKLEL